MRRFVKRIPNAGKPSYKTQLKKELTTVLKSLFGLPPILKLRLDAHSFCLCCQDTFNDNKLIKKKTAIF